MAIARNRLVVGVILGGLAGGVTLGGVLRATAGPGDPPVIVLPSARTVQQPPGIVPVQATVPGLPVANPPKLEMLPPPTSQPPIASPLIVAPEKPLQPVQSPSTLTPREQIAAPPPVAAAKEVAPAPRIESEATQPLEVLPPPSSTGSTPSELVPPGESTMHLKTAAAAAALTAMIAGQTPAADAPKQPVIEKITDYAKADDVKTLKTEIESLKKDISTLTGKATDAAKTTDVKSLQDEVAALKKEISILSAKPGDAKALKEDLDTLKKDVASLHTFLRETVDGKVSERGFTHDGVVKRLQKLDDSLDTLTKKMQALDAKLAEPARIVGSSPLTHGDDRPLVARGTVRIVNEYPIEIAIVVNGASHRLLPNEKKDVPVGVGSFKYQLLTSGGSETERSIKENETVTLTIR